MYAVNEAINQFQEVIRLKPDYVDGHNNLGIALGMKGQMDEAISQLQHTGFRHAHIMPSQASPFWT